NRHDLPLEVSLVEITIGAKEPRLIARLPAAYLHNIKLSRDRQRIALVTRQDGKDNIVVVPTRGGPWQRDASNSEPATCYSGLTWSPDGRTLFYSKQTSWALISVIRDFR